MSRLRPRYARLCAAGSAFAVTLVTALGGLGVLPQDATASAATPSAEVASLSSWAVLPDASRSVPVPRTEAADTTGTSATALPPDSGTGKRVVFDMGDQRVWLVSASGEVVRTYRVSGSVFDNLRPGSYTVYSRSRHATGIDNSGSMEFFVRFTRGVNAAIGFHSIPSKDGLPVQTRAELGTPLSHGCIRQARPDARRLWQHAPLGTKVVVTG